jgi:O-6-methylguanine DNA methyltransferase
MTEVIAALAELVIAAPASAIDNSLVSAGVVDGYVTRPSPLGTLYIAFNRRGVSAVDVADSPEDFERRFAHTHGRRVVAAAAAPAEIASRLDQAIRTGKPGTLPLDFSGLTEFQAAVLRTTSLIPGGQVRSYGWIAREIGKPGAVRAVGSALAKNPIPVVVPCHRVVRSDGHLGNYSLGDPDNKRVLLKSEGLDVDRYEALAGRGVRFVGSDTTKIFCHPTCSHAGRITPQHRVEFPGEGAAESAGYRPCKVCRPVAA